LVQFKQGISFSGTPERVVVSIPLWFNSNSKNGATLYKLKDDVSIPLWFNSKKKDIDPNEGLC